MQAACIRLPLNKEGCDGESASASLQLILPTKEGACDSESVGAQSIPKEEAKTERWLVEDEEKSEMRTIAQGLHVVDVKWTSYVLRNRIVLQRPNWR